ncbi:MAG: N(4)-(beta-N-acetylglucosaminyl)-L-asparaginase [Bacteroidota bacterium]
MPTRRDFLLQSAALGATALPASGALAASLAPTPLRLAVRSAVLATWDNRAAAEVAWTALRTQDTALNAAERGVWVPEADPNDRSVGLGGRPDRTGRVTVDACIMDHAFRCGAVAALEDILHPISVARKVMEETPHVMLVGDGARQFAVEQGFRLTNLLTPESVREWREWQASPAARPAVNIERRLPVEEDHDTIGMLTLDVRGHLAGACSTSGWAYKLRGRVGDSPLIGAGLYVDGEVGAATATGHGEEMIRVAAAHAIVEAMRHGASPTDACRQTVERLARITPSDASEVQAGLLAMTVDGQIGGFALQPGFVYVAALPEGTPEPEGVIAHRTPVTGGTIYTVEAEALFG